MMMRGIGWLGVLLLAWAGVVGADDDELSRALSLEPNVDNGARVYALCSNCHKDDGWGHADGSFPAIAGQHRKVVIKQLSDIRARHRDAPAMYPFADPTVIGGAQAIADVSAYIASMPPNTSPGTGPGDDLARGESLYADHCAVCHGEYGEGSDAAFFPRIAGQHYEYLKTQLAWIRDARRRNANWAMVAQLKGFDDGEIAAVADYVSRFRP